MMKRLFPAKRLLVLALFVALSAGSAWAEPLRALAPEQDYKSLFTQRQTVDLLITEALAAFKSPARVSHAGFTGKLPSNMEIVADRLLTAASLEPYRADLLFSAASAFIANGDVDKAVELYRRVLALAPDDIDAHSYLAAWYRFQRKSDDSLRHVTALEGFAPWRAERLKEVFAVIDHVAGLPVRDALPAEAASIKGATAIVTLGYALNPDGSMHETLIQRLEKTLELAKALPDALIVVTGGVPQNNKTEARLMAEWLVQKGLSPARIVEDNAARSTVENALFSRYALSFHKIAHCVVLSSGSHVRRAEALFRIACAETGPKGIVFTAVGAPDKPLPELQEMKDGELRGIYRDALKTMGLWSFRSYPLEER